MVISGLERWSGADLERDADTDVLADPATADLLCCVERRSAVLRRSLRLCRSEQGEGEVFVIVTPG